MDIFWISRQMEQIRVYLDTGASLPKDLHEYCECYQFPYDSPDRPKKNRPKLALPCEPIWDECHFQWDEATLYWEDSASPVPEALKQLIGEGNKKDYKHLGSALRMNCQIFLTADKKDIWRHKEGLLYNIYSVK